MKTILLSATQARNQFSDLITAAKFAGQVTIIVQSGKPVAQISPVEEKKIDWKRLRENLQVAGGIFTTEDEEFIVEGRKHFDRDLGNW